jgi:hypothetical protein
LERIVLRATLRDLELPFALLAVEPEANPSDHRGYYEKLDPVPECDPEGLAGEGEDA